MRRTTLTSVFSALFAALICAGSIIAIPVGPVPIVLQNAFAILSGLLLGPLAGAGAVALFLLAGAIGLPVFSGGRGGIAVFAGPTGGYLVGYLLGAFVAGLILKAAGQKKGASAIPFIVVAAICGFASVYVPGVLELKRVLGISFQTAMAKGLIPFLLGDAIKLVIIVPLVWKLRPAVSRFLSPDA